MDDAADAPGGAMFAKAAAFAANTLGSPGRGKGIAIGWETNPDDWDRAIEAALRIAAPSPA